MVSIRPKGPIVSVVAVLMGHSHQVFSVVFGQYKKKQISIVLTCYMDHKNKWSCPYRVL